MFNRSRRGLASRSVSALLGVCLVWGCLPQAIAQDPSAVDAPVGPSTGVVKGNRHALIISISRYANPATSALPGARIDKDSATQIAHAMQIPRANIYYVLDERATGDGIRQALRDLTGRVKDGDHVYVHYSGHGTRSAIGQGDGCVEALLAYDEGEKGRLTNQEMAQLLKGITSKTDKVFVMIDACHSGGVVQAASVVRTRSVVDEMEEGVLRPRFTGISAECARPVNIKTRALLGETAAQGVQQTDIIHLSASRHNEISFDDDRRGGLATQFVRDCMLRDAEDLDQSGAITMEEIRQCAQEKIVRRLAKDPNFKAHNLVLNGNANFVPSWTTARPATKPGSSVAPISGEQALRQMYEQRDAKRNVAVTLAKNELMIGQDALDLTVHSDRDGYVYLALAGSDNASLYLLFPNALDQNNQIKAGEVMRLPRQHWRVKASGPMGTDHLLVLVTDAPRQLEPLAARKVGPFMASLNDPLGRAQLGALMTAAKDSASAACLATDGVRDAAVCSDAYGAAMTSLKEVQPR